MSDENNIEKIDLDKVNWRGSREFFESLGEALDKLDDKDESYDFTWVGKRKAIIEAGSPINKTFRPDVESSKNWDTTENLFIEGDNLDALKLLQESYLGKVKMIYIDPPYNTGKDFVYHDNFKATTADYDEDTEYKDDKGNVQFKKNEKTNGRYHSDWLSMMYPRLKLAKNLLTEDGVVFISIGDDEQSNLKKLCDEVFGEDQFITQFIWEKTQHFGRQKVNTYSNADYVLCYARQLYDENNTKKELLIEFRKDEFEDAPLYNASNPERTLTFPAGSTKFNLDDGTYSKTTDTKYTLINPVVVKDGINTNEFQLKFSSRWAENTIITEYNKGTRYWVKTETFAIRAIYAEGKESNESSKQILFTNNNNEFVAKNKFGVKIGTNEDGSSEINDLFGKSVFSYPKPSSLIQYLLSLADGDIYLDFFAGSATTAHAIMQLNAYDNGSRKFITVQLPEDLDESLKSGNKNERQIAENAIEFCNSINVPHNLTEISKERIRRAGDKISAKHPDSKVDYGFRALKIADTNYKEVYKSAGEYQQSTLLDTVDNIKDDRSELDLLYGVLTQSAFELNRHLETRDIAGAAVYLYDYFSEASGMVACFSNNVPEDTIKAIAKLKPITAVFRDSSFTNSQSKVNLSEHFRILSPDTKVKVI